MGNSALSQPHWLRWALLATLVVAALAVLGLAWLFAQGRASAGTPAEDTLRFTHQKHVAAGVPCVFCHPGVLDRPVAGIPSLAKCVGCHQNIQVASAEGQAGVDVLMEHWDKGIPLRWPKVNDQPDFVYFSHRPHIAAGVYCEACHGNVGQMAVARPAYRINMGFCLACHTQQAAEKQGRLTSCATCHK
jgi:hypothetical protein